MADDLNVRSAELAEKLKAKRAGEMDKHHASQGSKTATGVAQAFKLSTEFMAAIVVGVGLGWGTDQLLGSSPFGLITFLILGFAAGVVNVMRASGSMAPSGLEQKDRAAEREQAPGNEE